MLCARQGDNVWGGGHVPFPLPPANPVAGCNRGWEGDPDDGGARVTAGHGGGGEESGSVGVHTALTATRRHGNSGAQINGRKVENLRKPNSRARRVVFASTPPRVNDTGDGRKAAAAVPGTALAYRTAALGTLRT